MINLNAAIPKVVLALWKQVFLCFKNKME